MPDGSVLRLDTYSEATVRYSGRESLVEIKRGQALLEVVHESKRRFRVAAGEAGAIAVGTQFDVYRNWTQSNSPSHRAQSRYLRGRPRG